MKKNGYQYYHQLLKYNNTKHSTIMMTPIEATKPEHKLQLYLNIRNKAKFKRLYPDLEINSQVRTYVKKGALSKGFHPAWSENVYKVISITDDGKQFRINNNTQKLYSRHELLLIKGEETKDSKFN